MLEAAPASTSSMGSGESTVLARARSRVQRKLEGAVDRLGNLSYFQIRIVEDLLDALVRGMNILQI